MTSESRGYSTLLLRKVQEQDRKLPIVQLAALCIAQNVPVTVVATRFSVSRAAVYSWFKGEATPHRRHALGIAAMVAELAT
jgi:hypothetical protein